ncbi:MAG: heme biosynthesis protein HemY [Rhodospirillales bacterium]|nr:heme biosynthesis protein HemY [Alphaproteobacteria bacterium]USO03820.1 MAG: heme biosynthesis protein HemY [Rhodospirillales bacterium]
MLRAMWFFVQIALVVAAALWLAARPGSIAIEWMDYHISLQAGIFLLILVVFVLVVLFFFRVLGALVSIPRRIVGFHEESARRRGYRALTKGFVSVAAGDAKKATQFSKQSRALLPDDHGLPLLLEAQAARLRGEEGAARRSFEALLEDEDAAFFGIRGLLKSALDAGEIGRALEYAHKAESAHPKQGWILKTVYDLEIRNHLWEAAEKTLKKAVRYKGIDREKARSDEIALLVLRSEAEELEGRKRPMMRCLEKAYALDPFFVPAVVRLAEKYVHKKRRRKAVSLIEKIWRENPHPDLLPLWKQLEPANKKKDSLRRMQWYERLVALNPDSALGQFSAAQTAIEEGLWGEAKAYLIIALRLEPSAALYKLMAKVELETSRNEDAVREWLEKISEAPPSKVWTCRETGIVYERWSPLARPHDSFNTIVWGYPMARREGERLSSPSSIESLMIEAA